MKIICNLPPFDIMGMSTAIERSGMDIYDFREEIVNLISAAKFKIEICSPFLEYNDDLDFIYDILKSKVANGVKVNILTREVDKRNYDSRYFKIKQLYSDLSREGDDFLIKNYHFSREYVKSSIHSKMIIVDEKSAYVGSGEIRKNSFEINFETGIIVNDDEAKKFSFLFKEIFSASYEIFHKGEDNN